MSKQKDLIKNTLIIGLGKVSTQLVSFILLPLYTFFLTPKEYGVVDLVVTYVALLVPAVTLQLEMSSFRFLIDAREDESQKKLIVSNVLRMILPILLVLAISFGLISSIFSIAYAPLITLIVAVTIFSNLFLQFARGFGDNKNFAIASIATGVTTLVMSVGLIAFAGFGAEGMLLSLATANLICAIYLFIALKLWRYIGLRNNSRRLQKDLIGYSLPLIPNGVSWWVINVSDRTIITLLIGSAANGIYAVSNKYAAIFSGIFSIFSMSWTESASVNINSKDRDVFFSQTSNAIVRLFGSFGIVLIATIPVVFSLLVSSSFNQAYMYIPILILAAFFNAIVGLYSAVYVAKRMTKQVMNTSLVAAGINILLTVSLMPFLGIYAAAISTAVAFLAMAIFRHFDLKKYVNITYQKGLFLKIAILYAIAIAMYYINTPLGNIINAVVIISAAIILNRSAMKIVSTKILSYTRFKNLFN
jgi:O-antigen/teichoic acid export membrane protein